MVKDLLRTVSKLIPDRLYIAIKYKMSLGRFPNLKNPQTFNEKLQWLKLHSRNSEYTRMVDKYEAKKFIADSIGEEYVIPTLGVWDKFDDIDFDILPDQFVLKCTHDSGGLVICRDKSKLDIAAAKKKIEKCLKTNYYWHGREWPYKNVKPRIIAEQYMDDGGGGLRDYKFFCFNGMPRFIYISQGLEDHSTARISFYDLEGNKMPFGRSDYRPFDVAPDMPETLSEMIEYCSVLSEKVGCPFVRIDFYCIKGKTYFGEITFSPCGGMLPFEPAEWDKKLGEYLDLGVMQ